MTPVYGLEVSYNGSTPLCGFSRERGGVSAHLYQMKGGCLRLDIIIESSRGKVEHSLHPVIPGDSLVFKFLQCPQPRRQTLSKLAHLARKPLVWRMRKRFRLGLDCRLKSGDTVRTSHPKGATFRFMLANVPLDHARAFVMAANDKEKWHWQLPDLHPGEELAFHIVETDWCSEPDR